MHHSVAVLIVNALYAVEREDGWHLARWDGKAFSVTSTSMQSGDRWLREWVQRAVLISRSEPVDNQSA